MRQKSTANRDLPPRMIRRRQKRKNGTIWIGYYYNGRDAEGKRKEIPLGSDLDDAKVEWARLERKAVPSPAHLIDRLFEEYEKKVMPKLTKGTQDDYQKGLRQLKKGVYRCPTRRYDTTDHCSIPRRQEGQSACQPRDRASINYVHVRPGMGPD